MWDKEKIPSLHKELNIRPSDLAIPCSTTEPQGNCDYGSEACKIIHFLIMIKLFQTVEESSGSSNAGK